MSLTSVVGRHHSRSASTQVEPAGGSTERSPGPKACTVTRLPRGVIPATPRSTMSAVDALGAGVEVAAADGPCDAPAGADASTEEGALAAGAAGAAHATTDMAVTIARGRLPLIVHRPAIDRVCHAASLVPSRGGGGRRSRALKPFGLSLPQGDEHPLQRLGGGKKNIRWVLQPFSLGRLTDVSMPYLDGAPHQSRIT